MPPPPPPAPPPPPTFSVANTEKPKLNKSEEVGRGALLADIGKGKLLKKTVTHDRSSPILDGPKGGGGGRGGGGGGRGGGGGGGGGGPSSLGGLFAGGMPKLKSAGSRESSDSRGGRAPILPPGTGFPTPRPFAGSNAPPPRVPGSFPRSNDNEPPKHRFPPSGQPKFSRSDLGSKPNLGSKPDLGPPPVPNTPRPSNFQSRGPPPVPGSNRPISTGAPPSFLNRQQGSSRHSFQSTPPLPTGNRPTLPPTPSRIADDRPSPSNPPFPSTNRPPLPPAPNRMTDDRPLPPPIVNRPSLSREGPPLPPPQNHKPPVPQTPRPGPSFQGPPLPPPNRPGLAPTADHDTPRLPQRNLSLHVPSPSSSPGPVRAGPLPPPPFNERPPPPMRDPPSISAGFKPPPPPSSRSSQKAPSVPQPPNRGGFRPPLPPDRGGSGPPPPPPPMRNGFQESSQSMCEDEWECRFSFHSISEFPPPEPYLNTQKTYPSKQGKVESRDSGKRERGAPPLPPIPR
uniref:WAS/WASL interacting protein family, member 1a n=1 Tax=Callorhinchus milii TaxID=7868 RepID=A0A4W3JA65_CALMI|eukprot:gi/632945727/ref/XP_007888209.1/ PREDICTED: WAS/WASL-interacting protein family member 1 isoform X1 [Callorhinchus milii]